MAKRFRLSPLMREATAEFWATFILVVSIQQRSEVNVKKWAKPRRCRQRSHEPL